ncbi:MULTISPECIES: LacI family DNA-binding transcriptional regulator [Glutamicibacter]|uniref:LacI family transcriptional regulator n=1 Tax=Glutamicibacter halophytocola TaxID=1933880 RepID=A0A5B8I2I7_9MICC|nr:MULTISPECIES: LacI family DNA-binding transcriptional regulator [Glutamicibacter]MBF6673047.1 LacI family DNA-binding transcriptional regulator [Glutamicibacter sp. FBE19]QDY66965.1 LacI family transcriptional regulator [Glutamicibacter halophytocola]UUX59111.1 LacI family transcriptional regulator [Glutamicibacter halophytocola]
MSKSMTIRDVAKAAGVSPATVSRTFVHPEKVESVTRDRILALAKEMNYRPNAAARSLITGLTGNIGIVVPDLTNPFFPTIVRSVQRKAEQLGYSALLVDTGEDVQHEPELTENLARQVDGLVLCSPRMSDGKLIEISSRYPLVMINREIPEVPAVTIDNRSGIAQEVAHLKALGHHRIGYVAGPETSYSCLIRQQAASELLAEAGLEEVSIGRFEPTFDGGRSAAQQVLLSSVTAVMVYNDVMALGLINQLTQFGVNVPENLTVVGYDDIEFSSMSSPALSTVHVPRNDSGVLAMDYLDALLRHGANAPQVPARLPTQFIFRETSRRLGSPLVAQ